MNIDQQLNLNESEDFTVNSHQGKGKMKQRSMGRLRTAIFAAYIPSFSQNQSMGQPEIRLIK